MCLDEGGSMDASEWPVVSASSGSMDASEWSEVSASNTGPVEEQAGSSSWEKVKNTPNMGFAAEASRQRGDADCRHDSSDHEGGGSSAVQRLPAYDDRAHAPVVQSRGGAGSPDDLPANHSSKGGDRSSDRPSVGDNAVEVLQPPIGWSDGCDNPFVVGHLVNHSGGTRPNVRAASFLWRHALPLMASEPAAAGLARFRIPNQIVSGFWFVCPTDGTRVQVGKGPTLQPHCRGVHEPECGDAYG